MKELKILLTDSYGAGWSTWARNSPAAEFILTYQPIIDYIEAKEAEDIDHDLHERHPLVLQMLKDLTEKFGLSPQDLPYVGGAKNLHVATVYQKSLVESLGIREHDGKESLRN